LLPDVWLLLRGVGGIMMLCEVMEDSNKTNTNKMVPYLNPEVLEVIYSHVNGKSLARCEQVCKLWKELIQTLSQVKDLVNYIKLNVKEQWK
jgi:hypothetical protein